MEKWRKIDGFPFYRVSNTGKVKGRFGKELSAGLDTSGYRYVILSDETGKRKPRKVHRLVAATFIGDVEGMDVHHKDGNRENNQADNLEILTHEAHMAKQDFQPYTPKRRKSRPCRKAIMEELRKDHFGYSSDSPWEIYGNKGRQTKIVTVKLTQQERDLLTEAQTILGLQTIREVIVNGLRMIHAAAILSRKEDEARKKYLMGYLREARQ